MGHEVAPASDTDTSLGRERAKVTVGLLALARDGKALVKALDGPGRGGVTSNDEAA